MDNDCTITGSEWCLYILQHTALRDSIYLRRKPYLWCINSLQEKYGPYYIDDGEEGVGIGCHDGAEVLQFYDFPVQRSLVF